MLEIEENKILEMSDVTGSQVKDKNDFDEELLLKTFLDYIPDEIFFKDREKRYLKINNAMASHLGLENPRQAIGKKASDFFPPEVAAEIEKEDNFILETGNIYTREQKRIEDETGSVKWVQITKGPLPDVHGNLIGIFGISKEITYLKEVEEKDKFLIQFQQLITSIANVFVKAGYPNFEKGVKFALYKFSHFLNAEFAGYFVDTPNGEFVEKFRWQKDSFKIKNRTKRSKIKKLRDFLHKH